MATISLIINGPTVGQYEYTINIPDTDAARIMQTFGSMTPKPVDEDGNQLPPTPQQVVNFLSQWIERQVFTRVIQFEKQQILLQARQQQEAVPPITKLD